MKMETEIFRAENRFNVVVLIKVYYRTCECSCSPYAGERGIRVAGE